MNTHTYTYINMCAHTFYHTCTYALRHMHESAYTRVHTSSHKCHTHIHAHMHICHMHTHTHKQTHTHTNTHTRTHTHTHAHHSRIPPHLVTARSQVWRLWRVSHNCLPFWYPSLEVTPLRERQLLPLDKIFNTRYAQKCASVLLGVAVSLFSVPDT